MKKLISVLLTAALLSALLCGCAGKEKQKSTTAPATQTTAVQIQVPNPNYPLVTDMAGSETFEEVTTAMETAGLSHVGTFRAWLQDFIAVTGEAGNLSTEWIKPEEEQADLGACADAWEKAYDYSDADCRITAMLLLDGILTCEKTEEAYTGTYLMFDLDALDNAEKYAALKKNRALFTTLFGEKEIREGEAGKDVFARVWQENGFTMLNDRVSLITVVCTDADGKAVFVGHAGVLVQNGGEYLFVEKLAFEQPYRATRVNSPDELAEILKSRPEYFDNEEKTGTWLYRNGLPME